MDVEVESNKLEPLQQSVERDKGKKVSALSLTGTAGDIDSHSGAQVPTPTDADSNPSKRRGKDTEKDNWGQTEPVKDHPTRTITPKVQSKLPKQATYLETVKAATPFPAPLLPQWKAHWICYIFDLGLEAPKNPAEQNKIM